MSTHSSGQNCPGCHYLVPAGMPICQNCGLALSERVPGLQNQGPFSSGSSTQPVFGNPFGGFSPDPNGQTTREIPFPVQLPGNFYQQPPNRKYRKIALLAVIALCVVGVGGFALFASSRNQPVPIITVTSAYRVGSTPAGSTGTAFHVEGQQFSPDTAISFLLDGQPVPGAPKVQSDGNGNINRANMIVTADWIQGNHLLTARDTEGNATKTGVPIVIVAQGEANTPGPNGAPPDDANFTLNIVIHRQDAVDGTQLMDHQNTLIIKGQADPAGGVVCAARDDGKPHILKYTSNGVQVTETVIWRCSGTYKAGQFTYIETIIHDDYVFSDGVTCSANTPYVYENLQGNFSSPKAISGTYNADTVTLNCDAPVGLRQFDAETGTWLGQQ